MIWGWLIPGWLRRGALVLGSVVLAALAAFQMGKREGRIVSVVDRMKAAERDQEAGRKRAGKAMDELRDGKTPEQIVRDNDGGWQ